MIEPSSPPRQRPLRMTDIAILVGSVAFGFALARTFFGFTYEGHDARVAEQQFEALTGPSAGIPARLKALADLSPPVVPALMMGNLACLLLSQRPRQFNTRRLLRQPGFLLSVVSLMALGITLVIPLLIHVIKLGFFLGQVPLYAQLLLQSTITNVPWALAGTMMFLAITGRWRPLPNWFDRLGRFYAFAWIGWGLLRFVTR